ncbi:MULTISPECIES: type II toxin-antitoxin system death-on-curing family toxin [Klebsiella]|uniref:type II toxin-antitoxin system death-on-curing family toxin n=1 Tax=Klebsiella TaxID=570 RepID=UPI000BA180C8|nr:MULTISPECIES: type II toxin-antitoxin system death-on-curing family toxin [Klebsiella]MBZ7143489.1 type II toxin-antitoxin system death-on-curing family toxin [Klebsiella michiganensis]MCW9460286.1 type II toxin-antitoxin system death-on-curing family toxin [Klebsiella michiganensis]MDU2363688.1 type II toxin-antitoxin system death-on-curing family toxin [Klebsiella michiganensis]MDU2413879.1 type II toxin-antitoxin system death-on-curing family toxin [Klebsiella michiganensis]OZS23952.1 hy
MRTGTVEEIHNFLSEYYVNSEDPISPPGVKDVGLLESACARPFASAGGQDAFGDVYHKAAALFHGIISNHCFYNGNKRTALLSALYFLSENNLWLERCNDEEMFEFTRQVAAHEICDKRDGEIDVIADWFNRNTRRIVKGEKPLNFAGLRESLSQFDFHLEDEGQLAFIYKNGEVIEKVLKKGKQGMQEYDQAYIAELRKRLDLTPEHGVDSARFYGQKGLTEDLNEFMKLRVKVFDWLAKI